MIAIWPLCCVLLFAYVPARRALMWGVIGGYLLLPTATQIKFPGVPALDKEAAISLGVGIGALLFNRRIGSSEGSILFRWLAAIFILAPFVTASLNSDPVLVGKYYHVMTLYDGFTLGWGKIVSIIPFWVARRIIVEDKGRTEMLEFMLMAMLVYSLPMLFEIRASPQLHSLVYGFFPHDFAQEIRQNGFRSVVFLSHGLVVALFVGLAVIAAIVLARQKRNVAGIPAWLAAPYMVAVLILQKSFGATLIAGMLGAVALALKPRSQIAIAALIGGLILTYPALREANLIPLESIRTIAASGGTERLSSLEYRLANEDILLARANERPVFGWGSWGRNRVLDPRTGRDLSVTDGTWILSIGIDGWVGYLALFGCLVLPLLRLWGAARKVDSVSPSAAGLSLLLAFNLIDLLPNSSLNPVTWLLAGAISACGPKALRASSGSKEQSDRQTAAVTTDAVEEISA